MAKQHTRLALQPSSAKRWGACTASPVFIVRNADKIPAEESKPYADEGTIAHEHCANGLLLGFEVGDECPAAMRPHVNGYIREVLSDLRPGSQMTVEEKIPLWYMPERNGQVDCYIVDVDSQGFVSRLAFWDYKHGAGVKVFAEQNPQLLIYARSLMEHLKAFFTIPDASLVEASIYQPRARNEDGSARSLWTLTAGEVLALSAPYEAKAYEIQAVNSGAVAPEVLEFVVNDEPEGCGWCPAKAICPARLCGAPSMFLEAIELELVEEPKDLALPEAKALTVEQLARVWSSRKAIEKLIEYAETHLAALLHENPESVPALKLVASKGGHRKWTSEEEVITLLAPKLGKPTLFDQKLKSPAEIEKMLKIAMPEPSTRFANRLESLITKGEGKPTLALASDPRPALCNESESHPFTALSGDEQ